MEQSSQDIKLIKLIEEFKKLRTPQRTNLLSNFLSIHTDLLEQNNKNSENIELPNEIPILQSNTPGHIPWNPPIEEIDNDELGQRLEIAAPQIVNDEKLLEDGRKILHNGKYTTEFKEVAVELARKLNNNTKAARDLSLKYSLNIQEKSLRDWRKEFKPEEDDKRNKQEILYVSIQKWKSC